MKTKQLIILGIALLLAAPIAQAEKITLVLGSEDGLPGECEICKYDTEKGIVHLRSGEKCGYLPFDSFSLEARKKITEWACDNAFLSGAFTAALVKKDDKKPTIAVENGFSGTNHHISYKLTLKNTSALPIKNVNVEFFILYENKIDNDTQDRMQRYRAFTSFYPNGNSVFYTPALQLQEGHSVHTWREQINANTQYQRTVRTSKKISNQITGTYILLSKKDANGNLIYWENKTGRVPSRRRIQRTKPTDSTNLKRMY